MPSIGGWVAPWLEGAHVIVIFLIGAHVIVIFLIILVLVIILLAFLQTAANRGSHAFGLRQDV
jgi:hypothetical protein